ncbi:uncharacterized protein V1518DRAFT_415769 [Limtongia smithiae]|uniref:uncharacterized protein n=1 Tax=Limtongia smithiae TaxID=1125753 RepID=UPI0034CF6E87
MSRLVDPTLTGGGPERIAQNEAIAPIKFLSTTSTILGKRADVVAYGFADKIMILISLDGRMGKMYYVSLSQSQSVNSYAFGTHFAMGTDDEFSMLAMSHLTPVPLLGAPANDTEGHIYTAQIATLICRQNRDERRTVVVGMPPRSPSSDGTVTNEDRAMFLDILALVDRVRVW